MRHHTHHVEIDESIKLFHLRLCSHYRYGEGNNTKETFGFEEEEENDSVEETEVHGRTIQRYVWRRQ